MSSYSKYDIILVKYPFSDLLSFKVRPAIVISNPSPSKDIFIVPLTSQKITQLPGEFALSNWVEAGLNVQSYIKRGIFTIDESLVILKIGKLQTIDIEYLKKSIVKWLN